MYIKAHALSHEIQHKYREPLPPLQANSNKGFALIATISVMTLLVMVALAMLSLTTLESRSTQNADHMAKAQANARLSLMLALGDLQKSMGPDQNVNALSQILESPTSSSSTTSPWLTGVWQARSESLGQTPDYSRDQSFKRWLISHRNPTELENLTFASNNRPTDPITLVGEHTTGETDTQHHAQAGKITITGGKLAWWIGDENSKALATPVDTQERAGAPNMATSLAKFATPGTRGIESIGALKSLETNTVSSDKAITHNQLAYHAMKSGASDMHPFYHDLTTYSQSILCNVSQGGLRKDLNLYLERTDINWLENWPQSGGPRGPLGPNGKYALSPSNEYDILSWKHLHHHYHSQRMVSYSGGRPTLSAIKANQGVHPVTNPRWNSGVTRPAPIPIRVQVFLAYGTIKDKDDPNKYNLRLYMYPVMTLWNPFNVDLRLNGYHILLNTLPLKHRIFINGTLRQTYGWSHGWNNFGGSGTKLCVSATTLRAGESRTFSPVRWEGRGNHYYHYLEPIPHDYSPLKPGSIWGEGDKGTSDPRITVSGTSNNKVRIATQANNFADGDGAYQFLQTTFGWRGQDLQIGDTNWPTYLWSCKVGWRHEKGNPRPDDFSTNNSSQATMGSLLNAPRPFCVIDARLKALDEEKLPNKTWQHTIPAHSYAAATSMNQGGDSHTSYYTHPYAVDFKQVDSYEQIGEFVQRVPGDDTHGYFGSSYQPGGQTYITARELPLVPLTSLAQLQNLPQHPIDAMDWSGHGFQNHAIGNSCASPAVPANNITTPAVPFYLNGYINQEGGRINGSRLSRSSFVTGTRHIDRSYAANHLLWDNYFFSSLAAQDGSFYQRNGSTRNLRTVANEFFDPDTHTPLPNARYQPYTSTSNHTKIIDSLVSTSGSPTPDGYKKVAAHLMVAGGFNINSTSETAWANLLASLHLKRPTVLEATSSAGPSTQGKKQFLVSRYTLPNGDPTSAGGDEARWRSYRELTENEIEQLAKAIVVQVKARGPFRSLGEFINRRLSSANDDTSLYGVLQAALEDPNVDINKDYRGEKITSADIQNANYKFPKAALGSRYQGAPAYIMQADILQPIAPIITPRSDTFIIRSYGESRDASDQVRARVWCEATVQRYPEYLDTKDEPETAIADLTSQVNQKFGRRFKIISFRWLQENEI